MKIKKKTKGDALPFSLIASEILSRLPAKSDIGRCRCVCKEWNSFLSTPMFNRTHFQSNVTINDYKLLQFDSQPPVHLRTIALSEPIPHNPHPWPYHNVSVVASLDGLVCLAITGFRTSFVLWNPLTRAYKALPSIPGFLNIGDPVGLYYDDSCNDYKLVCVIHSSLVTRPRGYVYSHMLDSWREIEFPFVCSDYMLSISSPAIFCGQCVYFTLTYIIESENFDVYEAQSYSCIICFDTKTETFRKIQFPNVLCGDSGDADYYSGSLVVLNGCLHLGVSYLLLKHSELWRMDGTGDGWVKVAAFNECTHEPQRICTTNAGNWIAVLDQDDNSFKEMNADEFTKHYRCFSSPSVEYRASRVIYVETLVSPYL